MDILMFLIFGLIVGAIARFIVPGREPGGWFVSLLCGVVGAMLGGFMGRALGLYRDGEPAGFLMATIGAIIVVAAYKAISGRGNRSFRH